MNHTPVAIGLVLCEVVIVDDKTHNVTPVNCFSTRKLKEIPGAADFFVVAWLADGMGEMLVKVMVQRLDTLDEVFQVETRMRFDDLLKDKYFVARIRDCEFPVAGQFVVSLLVDGELVAHRKIRVHS
jgi:hypothetical protein